MISEYEAARGWSIVIIVGGILYIFSSMIGILLVSIGFIVASGKLKSPKIIIALAPQEQVQTQNQSNDQM